MAIYHCSCKIISRSKGSSAVGSSAYRSGIKMTNEYDGVTHDFTRKKGVVHSEIMLSENASKEWLNRERLWNEVEKVENTDGQLAREIEIALPRELNREQQIELTRNYVNKYFVSEGMCADVSIHSGGHKHKVDEKQYNDKFKDTEITKDNPHAHIMLTMRPIDKTGEFQNKSQKIYICKNHNGDIANVSSDEFKMLNKEDGGVWEKQLPYYKNGNVNGDKIYITKFEKEHDGKYKNYERVKGQNNPKKVSEDRKFEKWDSVEFLKEVREGLAKETNIALEKNGFDERVDHRSYKEQGNDKIPTKHEGYVARAMEKRGEISDRVNINREIKKDNQQIEIIKYKQTELFNERKGIKQDNNFIIIHESTDKLRKAIPNIKEKDLVLVRENIKKLDGAVKENTKINYNENRIYSVEGKQVPYIQYHLNKYEHDREYLVKAIENNLKENKHLIEANKRAEMSITSVDNKPLNNAQRITKELESKRKEYINVYKQLEENKKPNMRPQVNSIYKIQIEQIRRYEDNVNRCNQSISTNQKEREGLGILKFKEKKDLDNNIKRLESLRAENLENLKQLGVNDLSKVGEVIKEKELKVSAENQKVKEFDNKNKELQNLKVQLKREYKEFENKIPTELREEVKEIIDQEKNSSKDYVEKQADRELHAEPKNNTKELIKNKSKSQRDFER